MTQEQQILKHLKQGLTLSARGAARQFDCYRLAARVYDLRCQGHKIKTEMTSDGDGKHWAVYYL